MKTLNVKHLESIVTALYGDNSIQLKDNYPAYNMVGSMIEQTIWMKNNKLKDAAEKTERISAMIGESVGVESEESGRVVHMPSGTSAVGSRNFSQHSVDQLMRYAERDEQEAEAHQQAEDQLRKAYETIFATKFVSKAEKRASTVSSIDPKAWLAARRTA